MFFACCLVAWNSGPDLLSPKEETVDKYKFPMRISARFLVFSYVKYFANDPTSLPQN
jgi:hypothetical protein